MEHELWKAAKIALSRIVDKLEAPDSELSLRDLRDILQMTVTLALKLSDQMKEPEVANKMPDEWLKWVEEYEIAKQANPDSELQ